MGRPRKGSSRIIPTCHPDALHFAFGMCRICWRKADYIKNKKRVCLQMKKRYQLKHPQYRYGISLEEHTALLARGKCGICGDSPKTTKYRNLVIDHDHITLKVRGVLCRTCNSRLGWMENHEKEVKAYLEKGENDKV